jgi:hypothetical protein
MARFKSKIASLVLLLASTAATFVVVEIAFRLSLDRKSKIAYSAASNSIYRYNAEFGYEYAPNSSAKVVLVRGGEVVRTTEVRVGPYGNLGDGVKSWTNEDFKIAVFGDSFTANPVAYNLWTDYLAAPLSTAIKKNVSVMNLARDGFGLLSIVHLAARSIDSLKPDLVIFAFIADDLTRARFWRTNIRTNNVERIVVSAQQSPTPAADSVQDVMVLNPEIGIASNADVMDKLNNQFKKLQDESIHSGIARYTTSFLLNRIRYGEPYFSLRKIPQMPRVSINDFRNDEQFAEDVRTLRSSNIPILFVLLPVFEDFVAGAVQMNDQQRLLFESFKALAKNEIINLQNESEKPPPPFERFFLYPHDPHPSELGAQWYADGIAKAILNRIGQPQQN